MQNNLSLPKKAFTQLVVPYVAQEHRIAVQSERGDWVKAYEIARCRKMKPLVRDQVMRYILDVQYDGVHSSTIGQYRLHVFSSVLADVRSAYAHTLCSEDRSALKCGDSSNPHSFIIRLHDLLQAYLRHHEPWSSDSNAPEIVRLRQEIDGWLTGDQEMKESFFGEGQSDFRSTALIQQVRLMLEAVGREEKRG